ncbi:MAG TPA: hypothetical protein PKA34_28860 [Blastocatellia bacterium]|nr:hypothetical protein [Blastocatellia bacterium]HMV87137.1 hypothetical protein [Blastocatellia bacterium]HNG31013.1 hypothetical protein [Blastocatellia bacterium]
MNVTNTHLSEGVRLQLAFINGESGQVSGYWQEVLPGMTIRLQMSRIDPGVTGYAVIVAVNEDGCPINFNHLIGSAHIKLATGHTANLNAVGFSALYHDVLPGCGATTPVNLAFDGINYSQAPETLGLDNIVNPAEGIQTLLVVNSLNGNLFTGITKLGALHGRLHAETGSEIAFSSEAGAQLQVRLSDDFPNITPKFSEWIYPGSSGWMRLTTANQHAITGAAITFHSSTDTAQEYFNGGRNLHHLKLTNAGGLTGLR